MITVGIIIGSTRPGRKSEGVARWVQEIAAKRSDAKFELVDLKDFPLPHLGESLPPELEEDRQAHIKAWAEKISSLDAYIFITPEYNHGPPGVLKNAIDYLYDEWSNKAAGFVSYGGVGGARAVEHLRLVMAELQIADVRSQVSLSLFADFENYSALMPLAHQVDALNAMLDQLLGWAGALKTLRIEATSV
ncbi:NADPH-dependent oxidoreductase [Ktedonosporobacter rubrisoli]|uniref:NADPH-dependent oxidoreductase n=1 Tax=Ktedonosporobacter rubrisoli TaxID=2509675 RepID=A0A4V0YZF0_KTERU|nr:NAD(P)H-dependent oxidoreductase [Ktedonosporobacter rubrisoli]QBD79491.1 NADPH-dependent oxidoreductase [Ktedonosporobacter rubrisoli]